MRNRYFSIDPYNICVIYMCVYIHLVYIIVYIYVTLLLIWLSMYLGSKRVAFW